MKTQNHFFLFFLAVGAWLAFYLIGIPSNYFQDWSAPQQTMLSFITFFAALPLISFIAMISIGQNYMRVGVWLAFYGSVPLAIIDFFVFGVIQKGWFDIYLSHWYVALGYFYIWIICPLIGFLMDRIKKQIQT